jgi:type II secretion system protein J
MTRPWQSSLRSNRGFTLLELLIATAVGATVLLVINATFFTALRLYNGTHDSLDRDRMLERTLAIVRRDISGIMVPGGVLSGQLQTTNFSSTVQQTEGDRITPDFYTSTGRVDGWTPFADVQMVAYYLAPSTDGGNSRSLVRAVSRNLLPTQTETPEEQVLMTGVADASVMFYDGSGWTEEWDSSVPRRCRQRSSSVSCLRRLRRPSPIRLPSNSWSPCSRPPRPSSRTRHRRPAHEHLAPQHVSPLVPGPLGPRLGVDHRALDLPRAGGAHALLRQ